LTGKAFLYILVLLKNDKDLAMSFEILPASPEAMRKIKCEIVDKGDTFKNEHHRARYPFDSLKIGECFTFKIGEFSESSVRLSAFNVGKKTAKKFTVIKHKDLDLIEVARIE
jgi:hypothetical protein